MKKFSMEHTEKKEGKGDELKLNDIEVNVNSFKEYLNE